MRLENPGPPERGPKVTPILDAIAFAREHIGEWVYVKDYTNNKSAVAVGWKVREEHPDMNYTTRGAKLFLICLQDNDAA